MSNLSDSGDHGSGKTILQAGATESEGWLWRGLGLIWTVAGLILALIWIGVGYQTSADCEQEIAQISRSSLDLARAFEEHTVRILQGADRTLLFLKSQYEKNSGRPGMGAHLREWGLVDPACTRIGMLDEYGVPVPGKRPDQGPAGGLSGREYFQVHRQGDSGQLFIGKPERDQASGKWLVPLSRRINKPDGSFGGVVLVFLDTVLLPRFESEQLDGGSTGVALLGLDGAVRIGGGGGSFSANGLRQEPRLLDEMLKAPSRAFLEVDTGNGPGRLYAYRRLKDYPLIAVVSRDEAEVLASFRARRAAYFGFASLVSLAVLVGALAMGGREVRWRRIVRSLETSRTHAGEVSRLKSSFLASISHELRTPLNGIIGYAELLREGGNSSDNVRIFSGNILESGERLLGVVNRILCLAALEAGQLRLDLGFHGLSPLLDRVMSSHEPAAARKGVALELRMERGVQARCDKDRLLEVLNELVDNAVKFTKAGSAVLSVKMVEAGVRFAVSDTGPGLSEEAKRTIFEAFRQGGGYFLARQYQGAGLGLTLASGLVALMGGTLEVDSMEGRGATFHFTLPGGQPVEEV